MLLLPRHALPIAIKPQQHATVLSQRIHATCPNALLLGAPGEDIAAVPCGALQAPSGTGRHPVAITRQVLHKVCRMPYSSSTWQLLLLYGMLHTVCRIVAARAGGGHFEQAHFHVAYSAGSKIQLPSNGDFPIPVDQRCAVRRLVSLLAFPYVQMQLHIMCTYYGDTVTVAQIGCTSVARCSHLCSTMPRYPLRLLLPLRRC